MVSLSPEINYRPRTESNLHTRLQDASTPPLYIIWEQTFALTDKKGTINNPVHNSRVATASMPREAEIIFNQHQTSL